MTCWCPSITCVPLKAGCRPGLGHRRGTGGAFQDTAGRCWPAWRWVSRGSDRDVQGLAPGKTPLRSASTSEPAPHGAAAKLGQAEGRVSAARAQLRQRWDRLGSDETRRAGADEYGASGSDACGRERLQSNAAGVRAGRRQLDLRDEPPGTLLAHVHTSLHYALVSPNDYELRGAYLLKHARRMARPNRSRTSG